MTMGQARLVAGVELGGTKCVCVLASGAGPEPGDVRETVRLDTTTPDQTLGAIAEVLGRWRAEVGFEALGIGSFGPLELDERRADFGAIVTTPKPGWSGADLLALRRRLLRSGLGSEIAFGLDTDVNGAALAEGRWGAARGLSSFAYVTVGTGIGVGAIVNGRPVRGLGHVEAGHLRVGRMAGDAWLGVCPYHGDCVEGLASGPAIAARAGRPGQDLAADDPVWTPVIHAMGGLLHNLVLTTAPERILIGGGVFGGQPQLYPRLRQALTDSLAGYAQGERIAGEIDSFIQPPGLGGMAGPLGAIAIGLDALA